MRTSNPDEVIEGTAPRSGFWRDFCQQNWKFCEIIMTQLPTGSSVAEFQILSDMKFCLEIYSHKITGYTSLL